MRSSVNPGLGATCARALSSIESARDEARNTWIGRNEDVIDHVRPATSSETVVFVVLNVVKYVKRAHTTVASPQVSSIVGSRTFALVTAQDVARSNSARSSPSSPLMISRFSRLFLGITIALIVRSPPPCFQMRRTSLCSIVALVLRFSLRPTSTAEGVHRSMDG